jgi:FkbM family methyltransferase
MTTTYEQLVVVTPARDEEANILRCINSVLNQTYPVTVHLIVDDWSEDRTKEIVESIEDERVMLISSGLEKGVKQHGIRPHLVQQVGIEKVTEMFPHWKYLFLLDGDCWVPETYCETVIRELKQDKVAMAGARYLKTPKKLEETSFIHVRSSNHIIKREFYDECIRNGRNYASFYGEMLLERFAWIRGWKIRTIPIMAYSERETGVTVGNPWAKGLHDYRLGTPLFVLLLRLRRPSKERLLQVAGWVRAWLKRESRCFTEDEARLLKKWYLEYYGKLILKQIFKILRWSLQKIGTNPRDLMFSLSQHFHTSFFIKMMRHELNVQNLVKTIKGDVFVDIGASIGFYSIILSQNFRTVIAVEPHPENVQKIMKISKALNINNIKLVEKAVSVRNGKAPLRLSKDSSGHSIGRPERGGLYIIVETVTLERLLSDYSAIDLVKVDVEGHEWKVLEGAIPIIDRIKRWIIELHRLERKCELERLLSSLGYSWKWLDYNHIYAWKEGGSC